MNHLISLSIQSENRIKTPKSTPPPFLPNKFRFQTIRHPPSRNNSTPIRSKGGGVFHVSNKEREYRLAYCEISLLFFGRQIPSEWRALPWQRNLSSGILSPPHLACKGVVHTLSLLMCISPCFSSPPSLLVGKNQRPTWRGFWVWGGVLLREVGPFGWGGSECGVGVLIRGLESSCRGSVQFRIS